MAKDKIIAPEKDIHIKITRQEIEKRITAIFADLQQELGDKKFKQRVKKVSKLLSHGTKKKEKEEDKTAKVKSVETKHLEAKKTSAPKKAGLSKKSTLKKVVTKKAIAVKKVAK